MKFLRFLTLSTLLMVAHVVVTPTFAQTHDVQRVKNEIEQFIIELAMPFNGEAEVVVGDIGRDFSQCDTLDVYLPRGRKLASTTTVGVRCAGEESASTLVRSTVKVMGVYYVPAQTIEANHIISPEMLEARADDLLRLPAGIHVDLSGLVGRIAKHRLMPGRPIRLNATRGADSIQRGQKVRIELRSQGFTVTNDGEALSAADVGGPIQVKTPQGKIVQGVVLEGGVVAVSP